MAADMMQMQANMQMFMTAEMMNTINQMAAGDLPPRPQHYGQGYAQYPMQQVCPRVPHPCRAPQWQPVCAPATMLCAIAAACLRLLSCLSSLLMLCMCSLPGAQAHASARRGGIWTTGENVAVRGLMR